MGVFYEVSGVSGGLVQPDRFSVGGGGRKDSAGISGGAADAGNSGGLGGDRGMRGMAVGQDGLVLTEARGTRGAVGKDCVFLGWL